MGKFWILILDVDTGKVAKREGEIADIESAIVMAKHFTRQDPENTNSARPEAVAFITEGYWIDGNQFGYMLPHLLSDYTAIVIAGQVVYQKQPSIAEDQHGDV